MTVRISADGCQLDTSADRLDLDRIERWLATESYWALGRSHEVIERSLANSTVYGLYAKVGFVPPAEPEKWMELRVARG